MPTDGLNKAMQQPEQPEKRVWYRFDLECYAATLDPETERPMGKGCRELVLTQYLVLKTTAKGVHLGGSRYPRRTQSFFVLLDARKRYACPTVEEARESFIARKERQFKILKARLDDTQEALWLADPLQFPRRASLSIGV